MFGYNDMNTYTPNPFVTQGSIVLSGAGRRPMKGNSKIRTMDMKLEDWARMMKNSKGDMGVNDFVKREREMNKELKSKGKKELKNCLVLVWIAMKKIWMVHVVI
jgi:hypothetical protein